VPFYQRRFAEAGVHPNDIRGPHELSKLAILERDDARDTQLERSSVAAPYPTIHKSTSGTLGKPLAFGYDAGSEAWRNAVRLRGYRWAGYELGARALHYWARSPSPPPLPRRAKAALDNRLKRNLYVDCTPRGDADLAHAVETIQRYVPDAILTYSQAGAALARYVNRIGARTWQTIPVICGAERLFDVDRRAIENAFGPAVYETYGSREFMLIATECPAHAGLHQMMENLVVEIVVRRDGTERPAEPGEIGEVVITDLHNFGMPFIRYANGDLAVAGDRKRCACGRELQRMGPIEGRVTETLRDGKGNAVGGLVFNLIFVELAQATRQFQVIQHGDRSITLKLVPNHQLSEAHLERLRRHAAEYLRGVEIRTEVVTDIPPGPSGKRQVVLVEHPERASA
jgi:phenylacetate-CoA ligase